MEQLNELEKNIINDYVQIKILEISHCLKNFNNELNIKTMPNGVADTIIKYLSKGVDGKEINLLLGKEGAMLKKDLSTIFKEIAIKDFLYKLNNKV